MRQKLAHREVHKYTGRGIFTNRVSFLGVEKIDFDDPIKVLAYDFRVLLAVPPLPRRSF